MNPINTVDLFPDYAYKFSSFYYFFEPLLLGSRYVLTSLSQQVHCTC